MYVCLPIGPDLLLSEAIRLGTDRELGRQLGEAGRRYCDDLLSEESALDRYEQWIIDLADMRARGLSAGQLMVKRALITGITGQDGSYLAEFLLNKGYEVHGIIRRASTFNTHRIDHLYVDPHVTGARLFLHYGELMDGSRLSSLLSQIQPDEVYHLAAQSHVRVSFDEPEYTCETTGLGTIRLLEAIRQLGLECRFYQASSSEMFGSSLPPQNEDTPFHPCSPYGASKLFAYWAARNYREAYGLFAVNGILFNHESPRRGETFVTRKITRAVARIRAGLDQHLWIGNIDAVRDWGYAPEYVEGMWQMLQARHTRGFRARYRDR